MSDVYAVMVFERHSDPDVEIFTSEPAAVARAREIAEDYARSPEDIEEPDDHYGWLYYAGWGTEGDHVWVDRREVKEAP